MPQQKNRRERVMGCAQCGRDTLPFGNVRTDQKAATLADTLLAMAGGVATQGAVGIAVGILHILANCVVSYLRSQNLKQRVLVTTDLPSWDLQLEFWFKEC